MARCSPPKSHAVYWYQSAQDRPMKLLIPFDSQGWHPGNPFTQLLPECLARRGACVFTGRHWLTSPDIAFDVVNIQWPEYTVPSWSDRESATAELADRLERVKRSATVVATVHNEFPHRDQRREMQRLYQSVYAACDGFVHMGRRSIGVLEKRFPREVKGKPSVVIPHGNYAIFGKREDRAVAKEKLGLSQRPVGLLIGAIRSAKELRLSKGLVDAVLNSNGQVIFAAKLPGPEAAERLFVRLITRVGSELMNRGRQFVLQRRRGVVMCSTPIPFSEMARLGSAADVTLIPRIDTLNSGNLPFGYTYGSVVCGPDVGNVGEILRETGNVVFDPHSEKTALRSAVSRAFDIAAHGHGENNYAKAHDDWSWHRIGASYMEFFESLRDTRGAQGI